MITLLALSVKLILRGPYQSPFLFLFVLILHLSWDQVSVCVPISLDGPSMKHLLAGQRVETWVNSTNQQEEKRMKKQT